MQYDSKRIDGGRQLMKIDEFKATLRQLAYTTTDARSGIIKVYSQKYWQEDNVNGWCFRLAPARKKVIVDKQWDKLDDMPVFNVRDLLNLIAELEKTPIRERFPEKKYRLRWIDSNGIPNYLDNREGVWTTESITNARCYTESELDQLKKDNPRLAPAIDAMKEPAEGKDE